MLKGKYSPSHRCLDVGGTKGNVSRIHPLNVWTKSSWNRLQTIQTAAARLRTRSSRGSHVTPIGTSLHWLPVGFEIHYKILESPTWPGSTLLEWPFIPPHYDSSPSVLHAGFSLCLLDGSEDSGWSLLSVCSRQALEKSPSMLETSGLCGDF